MTINPAGAVQPIDYGVPHAISARTNAVVSGGQVVYLVSGTSQTVGSGLSSFVTNDILVNQPASGVNFPVGVAVANAGSNELVSVMKQGFIILNVEANTTSGEFVTIGTGVNVVAPIASGTNHAQLDEKTFVGRALTSAASGGYALIHVNIR